MSLTPRERIRAVLAGEEPDKTPVIIYDFMRAQVPKEWYERLRERGLGLLRSTLLAYPAWSCFGGDPRLPGVKYTTKDYAEDGLQKRRHLYETPVGDITCVMMADRRDGAIAGETPEEYLIKETSDWRVMNHILKGIVDNLTPANKHIQKAQEEVGEGGMAYAIATHTAWQMAWSRAAGPERSLIDFHEKPDDILEYIDLQERWHGKKAEFAGECPAEWVYIADHISDMTSPKYYREYCLPMYELYSKQLKGSGKTLTVHMDGRLGHLKEAIAESPIDVVESFSVPPTGDFSLSEAKELWPDKMVFMNTASHLAWAEPDEVRAFYEGLAEEWGTKKGLILEFSEQLPIEMSGPHLWAALDAFGY